MILVEVKTQKINNKIMINLNVTEQERVLEEMQDVFIQKAAILGPVHANLAELCPVE